MLKRLLIEMIHTEYAVPYWWNYGLFETVPFYIGIAWDGCGVCIVDEHESYSLMLEFWLAD